MSRAWHAHITALVLKREIPHHICTKQSKLVTQYKNTKESKRLLQAN